MAEVQLAALPALQVVIGQVVPLLKTLLVIFMAVLAMIFFLLLGWLRDRRQPLAALTTTPLHYSLVFILLAIVLLPLGRWLFAQHQDELVVVLMPHPERWHAEYLDGQRQTVQTVVDAVPAWPQKGQGFDRQRMDVLLHFPAGKKVRLLINSDSGVQEAWWPVLPEWVLPVASHLQEYVLDVPQSMGRYRLTADALQKELPVELQVDDINQFDHWLKVQQQTVSLQSQALQKPSAFKNDAQASHEGKALFKQYCASCHHQPFPVSLMGPQGDIHVVVDGGAHMPALWGRLTPRQIAAILNMARERAPVSQGEPLQPEEVSRYIQKTW